MNHQAGNAAQNINAANIMIGGELFALDDTKLTQKTLRKDYEFPMTLNGVVVGTIRLKRQTYTAAAGSRNYRLCPPNDTAIPDPGGLYLASGLSSSNKVNRWAQEKWNEYCTALDTQIKNQEEAEENARAERERASLLLKSSGSQPARIAPINDNAIITAAGLATAMLPMNVVKNNPKPVHATTSAMVNLANTMALRVEAKADINNINPQISRKAQTRSDKIRT